MAIGIAIERHGTEPLPAATRTLGARQLFAIWWAAGLGLLPILVGGLAAARFVGLGWWDGLAAIAIGTVLAGALVGSLAACGAGSGLSQLALSRSVFGRTAALPALVAWLTLLAFASVYTVYGAQAVVRLSGGVAPLWVGGLVVGIVQLGLAVVGFPILGRSLRVAAAIQTVLFAVVTVALAGPADLGIADAPEASAATFVLMVAIAGGLQLTWALTATDYARFARPAASRRAIFGATSLGLILPALWLEGLGLAVARAMPVGVDPVQALVTLLGDGPAGAVGAIAVTIGLLAVDAMLLYSASLSALATGVRVPRPALAALTALLSLALAAGIALGRMQGWLENVLLVVAYWIPAWAAVMLVAAVSGRRASVRGPSEAAGPSLLGRDGSAIAATLLGTVAAALCMDQAIFVGPISDALGGADLGALAGIVVGGLGFVVLERVPRAVVARRMAAMAQAPIEPGDG